MYIFKSNSILGLSFIFLFVYLFALWGYAFKICSISLLQVLWFWLLSLHSIFGYRVSFIFRRFQGPRCDLLAAG